MENRNQTQKSKIKLIATVAVLMVAAYVGFKKIQEQTESAPDHVVAVTQIIQHDSLDKIRKGILDELAAQKIRHKLVYENAQGNIAIASQIATKFASQKPDVIVAITTPSAQAAYSEASKTQIPVVYGAVSDPLSAKLVSADNQAKQGVTGVSDLPPIADQVAFISKILEYNGGKKHYTVGVLYNSGEANSVAMLQQFRESAAKYNINVVEAVALRSSEVLTAAKSLVGKADLIYIPNDNTVISSINSIIQLCIAERLPIVCSDPESVEKGCLGAVAIDQYLVGRQTGEMVARVLKGEPIVNIQPQQAHDIRMTLNLDSAKRMGLKIPKELVQKAHYTIHH